MKRLLLIVTLLAGCQSEPARDPSLCYCGVTAGAGHRHSDEPCREIGPVGSNLVVHGWYCEGGCTPIRRATDDAITTR